MADMDRDLSEIVVSFVTDVGACVGARIIHHTEPDGVLYFPIVSLVAFL